MWRPHGHTRSLKSAFGVCDSCNFVYNLNDLKFQYDYAGVGLINKMSRRCPRCLDKPAPFARTILLPADPIPVPFPRPNQFASQMGTITEYLFWNAQGSKWDTTP